MQIKILCVNIVHTTVRTFNVIFSQAFRNFVLLISLLKVVLAGVRLSNVWREYEFPMLKCEESVILSRPLARTVAIQGNLI
jgi:uncharacterized protein YebE (UPF0316 family)